MLHIIQSNKIEKLFEHLLAAYRHPDNKASVFEPFNVIVPSKVMGEWLKKQVADQAGISTLVTTEFWGRYLLSLMQKVLRTYARFRDDVLEVPEVAMLSKSVMQWQIFGLLMNQKIQIVADQTHPLHSFVAPLIEDVSTASKAQAATIDNQQFNAQPTVAWATNESLLATNAVTDHAGHQTNEQRLWQLSNDMASMLNRYMTYRPVWLDSWGKGEVVNVTQMIADKDTLHNRLQGRQGDDAITTPEWLVEHYVELEKAQRYLWQTLFDDDYRYREKLEAQFWQAFEDKDPRIANICRERLPKQVILFTVQQLPPSELIELQRLGALTEVTLLHFNPSQQFWADIVDKNWLLQAQLNHPNSVSLKDYGHTLLSRFGKQSREVFAMLANLSGNDYGQVTWQDDFVESMEASPTSLTLLQHIQQDILMLEEAQTQNKIRHMLALAKAGELSEDSTAQPSSLNETQRHALSEQLKKIQQAGLSNNQALQSILEQLDSEYSLKQKIEQQRRWQTAQLIDSSLSIHACHSMVRQLEVLRGMLVGWLNYTDDPAAKPENTFDRRSLSDVLVLLPDIEAQQNIIEAIFPKGVGADGYTLPAKVTGVVAKDINQLWQAIMGYYQLLNRTGARFSRTEVFDWLMLPPLYESFGLSLEQMSRACELLTNAGFVRGFDEAHLQQSLHSTDDDYRYSFAYALERLVAGLLMPQATQVQFGHYTNHYGHIEAIRPVEGISMADASIIATLCDIFETLNNKRAIGTYDNTVAGWLEEIESLIKDKFSVFTNTNALLAIFAAQNAVRRNIEANYKKPTVKSLDKVHLHDTLNRINTEALPFKLGFILDSLASELVSQQVSAEPAGVITFARIGAVRNLPYKLVVMLNLNLSDFPQREPYNRYNLMQAGIPSRGDRFREDDDLGAFLDAILCAKEACWLFYNGKSTIDTHEHLPASPVQELLSFLQSEVQWQTQPDYQPKLQNNAVEPNSLSKNFENTFTQQIERYLVTEHPALPFDKSYFQLPVIQPSQKTAESDSQDTTANEPKPENEVVDISNQLFHRLTIAKSRLYPPAKIWQTLYQQLNNPDTIASSGDKIHVWQKPQLEAWLNAWQAQQNSLNAKTDFQSGVGVVDQAVYETLSSIISSLKEPGEHFIKSQRIHRHNNGDQAQAFESLLLDALQRYQVNRLLLTQALSQSATDHAVIEAAFDEVLPAGVNRYQSLAEQRKQVSAGLAQFVMNLQTIIQQNDKNFAGLNTLIKAYFGKKIINQTIDKTQFADSKLFSKVAGFITPCHEQRVSITAVALDNESQPTPTPVRYVLTANIPASDTHLPKGWVNYLPTNGKEKYWMEFWLNHLCWQVARHTTDKQAAQQNGFSLWQFSNKKMLYLPAIAWQTAYQYLQDWLMVWQLAKSQVVILQPKNAIEYVTVAAENPDSQPKELVKQSLKTWNEGGYNGTGLDNFIHDSWQFLLAEQKSTVILPFLQTLGEQLYPPLLSYLIDFDKK